jgi:taurine--2-oxoglutarate transaminase
MVSGPIANYFETNTLYAGLTYSSHPLACAAAEAVIDVYEKENLIENANQLGKFMRAGLMDLAEKYPVIGEIRGAGLHFVLELVRDRESKIPLGGYNKPLSPEMQVGLRTLRENGLSAFLKWNWIFNAPPLTISEKELQEGLVSIEHALEAITNEL